MSLVDNVPRSKAVEPHPLLEGQDDPMVDKLVSSLLDYPWHDRLRWTSSQPLKSTVLVESSQLYYYSKASHSANSEAIEPLKFF